MPTPLEIATKPLALGLRIAFGATQTAFRVVQSLTGGAEQPSPPAPEPAREEPAAARPATPRRRAPQRRNTRPKQLDDVSITRKVETELFRDRKIAKGKISVNTAEGVVFLRGEAKTPEQINEIERRVTEVPEVNGVENLLHLPKTPAPTRADTPVEAQHSRRHKTSPADRPVTGRVTAERKPKRGETSPADLAKTHKGRQPAPLGSHAPEDGDGSSSS